MQFVNYSNFEAPGTGKVSRVQLVKALLEHETKNRTRVEKMLEGLGNEIEFSTAVSLFTDKLKAASILSIVERREQPEVKMIQESQDSIEPKITWDSLIERINEARSINKIQNDWSKVTTQMKDVVTEWKGAEGKRKQQLTDELKTLTAKKKALEAELEAAVGMKDIDVELVPEGIKGHILDVIDHLNKLNYDGSATRDGDFIIYYLDDSNADKEARAVKKITKQLGWKVKEDQDDKIIFKLADFNKLSEAFYRLPDDKVLGFGLKKLKEYVDGLLNDYNRGNDYKPENMEVIESVIEMVKEKAKKFNKKEEMLGTIYEADFGKPNSEDYSDEMSFGQLEKCIDYSNMIRERIQSGTSLDPWMHSQIAVAENELNSVWDAVDGDDGVVESKLPTDLRAELKKYIDKNRDELNKRADKEDWAGIEQMLISDFRVNRGSSDAKELITIFKVIF
jgi:hypothetical protein